MCPFPGPADQSGGVNISAPVGAVHGDIIGRDKITFNLGIDPEGKAKLEAAMAFLSEQPRERRRLAARWIIEIMTAVFVDEMRMLYVGASTIARDANVERYSQFVSVTEQHVDDFNNQLTRYISDLEISFISSTRHIEQRHLWVLSRLKSGPCSSIDGRRLFREMRNTGEQIHNLCAVQVTEYEAISKIIAEISEQVWDHAGRPSGSASLDALFRARLAIQSILLTRTHNGAEFPIFTIADDVHQSFALSYFAVDLWLMQHGMPEL
jgi:hypothetical protein